MLASLPLILLGLLAIGIMLFLHELGHFLVARLFDVGVDVLSFGIGPKLVSYHGKRTEFRISMIPFGGYCRMQGSLDLTKALQDNEKNLDKAEDGSYFSASPFKRFLIYLAGPLANFVLALILLTLSAMIPVERLSDEAYITPVTAYPSLFHSAIEQPNVMKGDKLIASGDRAFIDWQDAEGFIREHSGEMIPITVLRNGKIIETSLIPVETDDGWAYGIALLQPAVVGSSDSEDFLPGDRIISIDGKDVVSTYDVYENEGSSFTLTIERSGTTLERRIEDGHLPFSWKSNIRIAGDGGNPLSSALKRSSEMFSSTLAALGAFLTFHFEEALRVITGPVKAAESIGHITVEAFAVSQNSGIRGLLQLLAIISISLSAGNILPIPTFDGGQMLMALFECIRRKALSPRTYVILQIIGMILAFAIMVIVYAIDAKAYFFS